MSDYPKLREMGIQNPHEIEKYAVYSTADTDILRIVYDRKKGSLLPVSRRYKFPQVQKQVRVDSSGKTQPMYESSGTFRQALTELEQLKHARDTSQDVASLVREELRLLEEDVALRSQYIRSLLEKM